MDKFHKKDITCITNNNNNSNNNNNNYYYYYYYNYNYYYYYYSPALVWTIRPEYFVLQVKTLPKESKRIIITDSYPFSVFNFSILCTFFEERRWVVVMPICYMLHKRFPLGSDQFFKSLPARCDTPVKMVACSFDPISYFLTSVLFP